MHQHPISGMINFISTLFLEHAEHDIICKPNVTPDKITKDWTSSENDRSLFLIVLYECLQ